MRGQSLTYSFPQLDFSRAVSGVGAYGFVNEPVVGLMLVLKLLVAARAEVGQHAQVFHAVALLGLRIEVGPRVVAQMCASLKVFYPAQGVQDVVGVDALLDLPKHVDQLQGQLLIGN